MKTAHVGTELDVLNEDSYSLACSLHTMGRDEDRSVFVGGISEHASETVLYELMLQAGRIRSMHMPKRGAPDGDEDADGDEAELGPAAAFGETAHRGFAFVEYEHLGSVAFAEAVLDSVELFGRPIRVRAQGAKDNPDGKVFVANLDGNVSESVLKDAFPGAMSVAVARDSDRRSRNFGFVHYDSADDARSAVRSMNGAFLMGRAIAVRPANGSSVVVEEEFTGGDAARKRPREDNVAYQQHYVPALPPPPPPPAHFAAHAYQAAPQMYAFAQYGAPPPGPPQYAYGQPLPPPPPPPPAAAHGAFFNGAGRMPRP